MSTHLDLTSKFRTTTLSNYEVFMIGEALVNWLAATAHLGHASPASVIDYAKDGEALGLGGLILRDFVAWTSGRTADVEGCEERMRDLIANADLGSDAADRVDAILARSMS